MRARGGVAAALCAVLAVACSGKVNSLPVGARVTCASDADCPGGFFCSQALDRCVVKGGADQTPPALTAARSVTPRVGIGDTVHISFEVTEDLSAEPFVHLESSNQRLGLPDPSGRVYTLDFGATGLAAGTYAVQADLVDLYGNEALNQSVGSFTLDPDPPVVTGSTFTGYARAGASFDGTVTFNEPVGPTPTLRLGSGPVVSGTPDAADGTRWKFTHAVAAADPEGKLDLVLTASDVAGNEVVTTLGATTFDFTPPAVVSSAIARSAVRPGDTLLASVRFSEALATTPPPSFTLVPAAGGAALPVVASAVDAATYSLTYAVPAGAADASYTLTIASARDLAGNPLAVTPLGAVAFDSKPPSISAVSVDHANRLYRATQPITVTFTLGEASAATPAVKLDLGTATLSFTCLPPAGLTYTCASDGPVLATFPEGGANITISASDLAGNAGTAATPVTLDFTPPGLASPPATRYLGSSTTRNVNVQAVGQGSSWEIALLTTEPLGTPPTLKAFAPTGGVSRTLTLTNANAAMTSWTFTLPADPTPYPAATWTVEWNPVDQAGNQRAAPVQLITVEVDGTPPPAPDPGPVATPAILWTRRPWGTDTDATPVFQLDASLLSAGTDAVAMIAWDGPGGGAREVGRHAPTFGQGPFTMQLGADPAELYVSTLDKAGNESPRTRVVDVAWTASLAGKVPGSTFENPHRLETRMRTLGALTQLDSIQASGAAVGVRGDAALVTTKASGLYRPVANLADPGARIYYTLGADPGRGVIVLQGGSLASSTTPGDTWEWNGSAWRQVFPTDPEGDGNPPKGILPPLVFDPIRGGLLAYGSTGMWLYNGTSWKNLGAVPVLSGGIAWDARRALVVVYGSNGGTYEWAGSAWTQAFPAASPPQRDFGSVYYDTQINQTCLYGGRQGATYLADVWCYDGATWTQVPTAGTAPATAPYPRANYAFAWDAGRNELFVQSGDAQGTGTVDGKTWILRRVNGTATWFDATPFTLNLRQHAATYDPATRRVILGGDLTVLPSSMRAWDGTNYLSLSPGDPQGDGNPSFLFRFSNPVYVPGLNRVVYAAPAGSIVTWEWDRVSWAKKATGGASAAEGGLGAGWWVNGSAQPLLVTFGGNIGNTALGDTWGWNGTGWAQLTAAPAAHPASLVPDVYRQDAGLVTDPATNRLFRVGGYDSYFDTAGHQQCVLDVRQWNGSGWPVAAGGAAPWNGEVPSGTTLVFPPCTCRERVIWSPTLNTILLLDDSGIMNPSPFVIWEWRPATTSWAKHLLAGANAALLQGFFWDTTLGAPVIVDYAQAYAVDLTGNRVVPLVTANPYGATPPAQGTFTFDSGLGVAVAIEALAWTWESPAKGAPAQLFTADTSRAGGPDPAACVANASSCPIQRIDLSWTAGGSAPTGSNGVTLQAWTGGWQDLASGSATAAAPANLAWSWTPASAIPAALLFHGAARELTFQIVPRGTSAATTAAQLATDAVAVTIRYRRP